MSKYFSVCVKTLIAACILCVVIVVSYHYLFPKRPILLLENTHVDMGTISNKIPSTVAVKLKNTGTATLKIESLVTSCSCIAASASPAELWQGETGRLDITIDPMKLGSFKSQKTVAIRSNDGMQNVTVDFTIDPEFALEPAEVDFGKQEKGAETAISVHMRQLKEDQIEIKSLTPLKSAAPGLFNLSFLQVPQEQWKDSSRREYTIVVALSRDAPSGPFDTAVEIGAPCARLRNFKFPVKGEIIAPYTVEPHQVDLGTKVAGEKVGTLATISSPNPIEVVELKLEDEGLSVTCDSVGSTKTYPLTLSVLSSANPGKREGVVTFGVKSADKLFRDSVRYQLRVSTRIQ